MTGFQTIGAASQRVLTTLVAGLELEFGTGAGRALAARFLAAEESDFLWEARIAERWLGACDEDESEGDPWLDRLAILGQLDGCWFVAVSIVDGDGRAHGLIGRRHFQREDDARAAFAIAH